MPDATSQRRPPITDSPWFWIYLYAAVGMSLLAVVQPKFGKRQAELERQYQGRQRAAEKQLGQAPNEQPLSTPKSTIITLRPLYLTLAGVCAVGWLLLWWRHFRRPISETVIASERVST